MVYIMYIVDYETSWQVSGAPEAGGNSWPGAGGGGALQAKQPERGVCV